MSAIPPIPEDTLEGAAELVPTAGRWRDLTEPLPADATVEERLDRLAQLGAMRAVLADLEDRERGELGAGRGAGWKAEAGRLGRTYVTEPKLHPNVTDEEAWEAWALEHRPQRSAEVARAELRDSKAAAEAAEAAEELLAAGEQHRAAGDAAVALRDLCAELRIRREVVVEEKLLADLAKNSPRREPGPLVTAEGEEVAGVELGYRSEPKLTVRLADEPVEEYAGTLRERLGLTPELAEGGP